MGIKYSKIDEYQTTPATFLVIHKPIRDAYKLLLNITKSLNLNISVVVYRSDKDFTTFRIDNNSYLDLITDRLLRDNIVYSIQHK
jgi:hypothetical protein